MTERKPIAEPTPDSSPLLHVVLFEPEIPYNAGSVGRTCVATGCKLWLVRPLGFRVDSAQVRRAGLDYWQHLSWQVVNDWDHLLQQLAPRRLWLFSKRGTRPYHTVRYQPGDTLVYGSESTGLPPWLLERYPEQVLRIPMRPLVRSLNVSNAAAITIYEALRQWAAAECAPQWFA